MKKISLLLGSINGFLAVAIGAFGAHAIGPYLTDSAKITFETGSKYHFYHSLALLLTGVAPLGSKWVPLLFTGGIILFSGSLYVLAMTGYRFLGFITPIGGVMLLAAWFGVIWQILRPKS